MATYKGLFKLKIETCSHICQRLTSSSSSCSLSEVHAAPILEENATNKATTNEASDSEETNKVKVPIPLAEENKEPGVSFFLYIL